MDRTWKQHAMTERPFRGSLITWVELRLDWFWTLLTIVGLWLPMTWFNIIYIGQAPPEPPVTHWSGRSILFFQFSIPFTGWEKAAVSCSLYMHRLPPSPRADKSWQSLWLQPLGENVTVRVVWHSCLWLGRLMYFIRSFACFQIKRSKYRCYNGHNNISMPRKFALIPVHLWFL